MNTRCATKAFPCLLGLFGLCLPLPGQAKPSPLHYQFTAGETNVYAVDIVVQGENGQDETTGTVSIVTASVSTNAAILDSHTNLRVENRHPFQPGFYGGPYMRGMAGFGREQQLDVDEHGNVLRDGGDYALPVPLGELVSSIFQPLPPKAAGTQEIHDQALVVDAPQLTGPVGALASPSPYGSGPFFGGGFGGFDPRNAPATLKVDRQVTWATVSNTPALVVFQQSTALRSWLQTGTDVRLTAQAEAQLEFNVMDGRFDRIEGTAGFVSVTETTSRQAKIQYTVRRLTGAALAAALAPPVPPVNTPLSDAEVQKLITDLKSDDDNTRRSAIGRLNGATVTSPPAELMSLLAGMVSDPEMFNRMTAMNFLSRHATAEQVPVLLKVINDPDIGIRQNALKALTRLHDSRAIGPLVDLVARGGSFNNDATTALISAGPDAEKPVLALLAEKNVDTRRQACVILQQIGTSESLDALQKQMADPDQQLSQAAVEAVRAINNRQ